MKGWATIDGLRRMTRAEVMSWNDLLDAIESAEQPPKK